MLGSSAGASTNDARRREAARWREGCAGAALASLADQLEAIVVKENSEQAKELLRLLVKDIQVHDRRRIIPTYRIPAAVRAIPRKVGGTGPEAARKSAPYATGGQHRGQHHPHLRDTRTRNLDER